MSKLTKFKNAAILSVILSTTTYAAANQANLNDPIMLYNFVLSADNSEMYAIDLEPTETTIYAVNAITGKTIIKIPLSDKPAFGLAASPDGKSLFVSVSERGNYSEIDKIDILSKQIVKVIELDNGRGDNVVINMGITPDSKKLYAPERYNQADATNINVIDTESDQIITRIPKNDSTQNANYGFTGITIDHQGKKAYLADKKNKSIAILDLTTNQLHLNAITSIGRTDQLAINTADSMLYVSEMDDNKLVMIDLRTNKIIRKIAVGERPYGMAVTLDDNKIYVANKNSDNVSIVDAKNGSIIKNIPLRAPLFARLSSDGTKVYVANGFGIVSIIDVKSDEVIDTLVIQAS